MAIGIQPPVRSGRLAAASRRDDLEEAAAAGAESPAERLLLALELSDLIRDLAESTPGAWAPSADDLSEKARIYVGPLRAAALAGR